MGQMTPFLLILCFQQSPDFSGVHGKLEFLSLHEIMNTCPAYLPRLDMLKINWGNGYKLLYRDKGLLTPMPSFGY